MPSERNDLREIVTNTSDEYSEIFARRDRKFIKQYVTANLTYPTVEQINTLFVKKALWTLGDRYWKFAAEEYGDPELWWVLAWYNSKPTEAHVRVGDLIYIPHPIDKVLAYYGV